MTAHKELSLEETRMAEATEWFARLREGDMPPEAIAAWLKWCDADPDNLRVYRGVQEIWALTGDAGMVDRPTRSAVQSDRYDGNITVARWRKTPASDTRRPLWFSRPPGVAAAILVVTTLTLGASYFLWDSNTPRYQTARGTQRTVQLSDGSDIVLGGASAVRVKFGEKERRVQLDGGEVFFKVAHDANRPFVVHTRTLKVTAIGTAFTVRTDDGRTVVTVTEGKVDISASGTARKNSRHVRASAGEQVVYDATAATPTVLQSDMTAALGWGGGALTYINEPLSAVVARLNRYFSRSVLLDDPELGELHFTGTIFENQVEEWALGLQRVFPIGAEVNDDGNITLKLLK